jgi:NAD(P)-dependent dehydrogenase (short-subunit alcohol dehydrogenase family)
MIQGIARAVVVTGAGAGIGRASAVKFAAQGDRVIVSDIRSAGGQETVAMIHDYGGEAQFVQTDVGDRSQVQSLINSALHAYGRLDVMCNNAGMYFAKPFFDTTPEEYEQVVRVDQHGTYYGLYYAARAMKTLGIRGTIINMTSCMGFLAGKRQLPYVAAKGAVRLMTQSAAVELGPYGIRVVAVAPGVVDTPMVRDALAAVGRDISAIANDVSTHVRGRLLSAEEIGDVVVFLASPAANAINGSCVLAEDGMTSFVSPRLTE